MLDSSHVRFAAKIDYGNSYHYTKLYSYWMDWLNLQDILNTACNITSAGRASGRRWGGGLTMPVDTADQIVCTVGQTDGHSNPDHTTRRADVEWNSFGPHATLLRSPSGSTESVMVLHGLIWSAKSHL